VTVQLRPIRADEFDDWLLSTRRGYAEDMIRNAGFSAERAHAKAAADTEALFPGGRPAADQSVFVVEADGEPVGDLWVAERDVGDGRFLWVYDVQVAAGQRGHGYGRAAMLFAEDEARRRGLDRVALNVSGGNTVARGLYRSLGYEENAIAMSKRIEPGS
jgi:ribosomal protein S18 acetylase RimI-like enzyme